MATVVPALVPALGALAACAALVGCSGEEGTGGAGDASCAAVLEISGARYLGHGELSREPDVSGRTIEATVPACDDSGGREAAEPAEQVEATELAAVPAETAVLLGGSVYLREGVEMPPRMRTWFTAPTCDSEGSFELTGTWVGVTGPREPRSDGDLRPPYRVEVRVTGGPAAYRGATVEVHATERTDPALGPEDVRTSLWEGGQVVAVVRCDGQRFEATALRSTPPV